MTLIWIIRFSTCLYTTIYLAVYPSYVNTLDNCLSLWIEAKGIAARDLTVLLT